MLWPARSLVAFSATFYTEGFVRSSCPLQTLRLLPAGATVAGWDILLPTGVTRPFHGARETSVRDFPIPEPGHGQVLIKTKSSTICGSDIRAIYREHVGKGPEGYQGKIAGHEPCGQIVAEGVGLKRFKKGDRVIVYHISGCGVCNDCRRGYMISCTSPFRAAYGWQK